MSRTLASILVLAAACAFAAAQESNAPPAGAAAADAESIVRRASERLTSLGLRPAQNRLADALLTGVLTSADAGGELLSAAEARERDLARQGLVYGLGITLTASNGQIRIGEVFPSGPAAGKLKPGDTVDRLANRYATGFALDVLAGWIRDATGDVEVVAVRSGQKTPVTVTLPRAHVGQPAIAAVEDLPGGVRLVGLRGFWGGAADELARIWRAAATNGGPGVILDLRSAEGGDLDEVAAAARLACPTNAEMFAFERLDGGERIAFRGGTEPPLKGPTMVLTGPRTKGAAEVFAAALKATGQGVLLVGGSTGGDPLIREAVPFDDTRRFHVATRRLIAGGRPADVPVKPHVEVAAGPGTRALARAAEAPASVAMNPRRKALAEESTDESLRRRIEGDAVLERAVDILHALHALGPATDHVRPSATR